MSTPVPQPVAAPKGPQPIKVRLYGLVSLTKRRYVGQVIATGLVAIFLLSLWWLRWPLMRDQLALVKTRGAERLLAFGSAFPWIILAAAGLQALEALIVLRAFRRKEEEARRSSAGASPPPG